MSLKNIFNQTEKKSYELPSDYVQLRDFVFKNKELLMGEVVNSIEKAMNNNALFVEVFSFKNSEFIITILEKDFGQNLEHLYKHYIATEQYEMCPKIVQLQKRLNSKKILQNEKR